MGKHAYADRNGGHGEQWLHGTARASDILLLFLKLTVIAVGRELPLGLKCSEVLYRHFPTHGEL